MVTTDIIAFVIVVHARVSKICDNEYTRSAAASTVGDRPGSNGQQRFITTTALEQRRHAGSQCLADALRVVSIGVTSPDKFAASLFTSTIAGAG